MRELIEPVEELAAHGTPAVLVRAIEVVGFGAAQYDNALVATADGHRAGAVLRGVSDTVLRRAVDDVLADPTRRPRLVPVSISDPDAVAGGLSCGGSARLVVEPIERVPATLWEQLRRGETVALATLVDGEDDPVTLVLGSTGTAAPDRAADERVVAAARELLDDPRAQRTTVELDRGRALIDKVVPRTRVVAVGGGEVVDALLDMGRSLGWLVDALADGPEAVERAGVLGPADAVVVTSHHPRWGPDTLAAALGGRAFFVGALGSRRTQERRAQGLRERGLDDATVARIHGPVGLDLGGRTPAETALAICAEILAVRSGRDLPGLRNRSGAINS